MKKYFFLFLFLFISLTFSQEKLNKIAILKIENRTQEAIDTEFLTETLQIEIVNRRYFVVVERSMLGKVIEEQKLSLAGLTEEEQATKIGALVGAEKIWLGSLSYTGVLYVITIKSIDTKTGIIEFADQVYSYTKDEFLNIMPVLADRLIRKAKGENIPKHEPKKVSIEKSAPSSSQNQNYNQEYTYQQPSRMPDSAFDVGGYYLNFSDKDYGYAGLAAFRIVADSDGELLFDFRLYYGEHQKWQLSGYNFNLIFNLNLIANGYILLGGGIGLGLDFPSFKKDNYKIDCMQWTFPLSGQFGFHLGRYVMLIFDASFVFGVGLSVLDNNYSISEPGKYLTIEEKNHYIPNELEGYLVNGVNPSYFGARISILF
ncbi:MAG: hypothetical protein N2258_08165 [Brevinematales bacterium]|nr:hypothetical protein [Brevinematales bacterium]